MIDERERDEQGGRGSLEQETEKLTRAGDKGVCNDAVVTQPVPKFYHRSKQLRLGFSCSLLTLSYDSGSSA